MNYTPEDILDAQKYMETCSQFDPELCYDDDTWVEPCLTCDTFLDTRPDIASYTDSFDIDYLDLEPDVCDLFD